MRKECRYEKYLRIFRRYLIFFLLAAFFVSCTTSLFVSALADTLHIELNGENLSTAAKLTLGNVLFLTVVFIVIDLIRRKLTVERAAKHIGAAAKKLVEGDFQVRVETPGVWSEEYFDEIVACFNQLAEELSSVETLRTDFIANVSHELKTPLAVMQNYAALLQTPDLPEEKRMEYAKNIEEGSKRLADMMTNILKLNRLENQKIYPESVRFLLGEQLAECLLNYEAVWEKRKISLETELEEDIYVEADRELLSLVWNNLFSNAFKFTPEHGNVWVRMYSENEYAVIQVQDTGCGISPEIGKHIFEKFYQGDTSHSVQGNGLGLALVKRVVDILHGEIQVDSALGEGSTFTVKIRKNLSK